MSFDTDYEIVFLLWIVLDHAVIFFIVINFKLSLCLVFIVMFLALLNFIEFQKEWKHKNRYSCFWCWLLINSPLPNCLCLFCWIVWFFLLLFSFTKKIEVKGKGKMQTFFMGDRIKSNKFNRGSVTML